MSRAKGRERFHQANRGSDMRHVKKTLGLLAAAPLALLVGCAEVDEPFEPADEPGMEQQQEEWLPPTEQAPPPDESMEAPPAEGDGMGAPTPEGGMGTPRAPEGDMQMSPDEDAMEPESPAGTPDDR